MTPGYMARVMAVGTAILTGALIAFRGWSGDVCVFVVLLIVFGVLAFAAGD